MSDRAPRPVALVTGASRGLGEVLARFLAEDGYDLLVTARGAEALAATVRRLARPDRRVEACAGDVSDPAHRRALRAAVERLGRLDLLVNNASELGPSPRPELLALPPSSLARIFEVNTLAPLALVQEFAPELARAGGWVVNITSDAAREGYAGWGGYGASKAALELLSATLARELAERRIAVVTVDPGDLRTAMHQAAFPGEDISDRPLPEVTLPFWAWLVHQDRAAVNGRRFRAQADRWELGG